MKRILIICMVLMFVASLGLAMGGLQTWNAAAASCPTASSFDVTDDLDVRVQLTAAKYNFTSPSSIYTVAERNASSPNRNWQFLVVENNRLRVELSFDGTNNTTINSDGSLSLPSASQAWLRFTRINSTGVITFYQSTDGSNWNQIGATKTSTSGNLPAVSAPFRVGAHFAADRPTPGKTHYADFRIGGVVKASGDFTAQANGATSWTDAQGNSWSVPDMACVLRDGGAPSISGGTP